MTCTQARFESDVAKHAMTVIRDDGVNRHIKFRQPDSSSYWFEILTWHGTLCIKGDCGTYVFSRLSDMFEFFRTDDRGDPTKLYTNEGYWCEKLQAVSCDGYGNGAAKRFDAETFEKRVKERIDDYCEGRGISAELKAELLQEVQNDVLDYACDGDTSVWSRLNDFEDKDFPRLFEDCWEWNCDEYTFRFIWNLYAIAWAIRQYDAAMAPAKEAA